VEREKPNLMEDQFPHDEPPRITFDGPAIEIMDGKKYEIDLTKIKDRDIHITDTTFRDGQQARAPYTIQQMLQLYDLLAQLSGPHGVIRNTELFVYSRKDREAVTKFLERGYDFPKVTGWIRAEEADLHMVASVGIKETGMLTSCSDYHIYWKLKKNRAGALEHYTRMVREALNKGIRPRCHLEDVTRADIDGFVVPLVQAYERISEEVPEDMKVKIRLCDTMGFGVNYPGATLPRSVPKLILKMIHDCGIPSSRLEWHGHNDFHRVFVNGTTAWLYGADGLNCTLVGIGERTGNPPLEGAIFEYIGLKGGMCGIDTSVITDIAHYYRSIGTRISVRYPFVGDDFHKTRAGIHAGGLAADERIYSIFDTKKLLKRPSEIMITDKSGSEGVSLWVNNYLGLHGKNCLGRTKMVKIMRWVADQYDVHGRLTSISDREMAELVKQYLPKEFEKAEKEGRLTYVHHDE